MKKLYLVLTLFLCVGMGHTVVSQTTISTNLVANTTTSPGGVTFVVQNTNAGPVMLTDIGYYISSADNGQLYTLYYSSTSLSGPQPTVWPDPNWPLVGSALVTGVTTTGIQNIITGLSFLIPGNTTYRFSLTKGTTIPTYASSGPNTFNAGGVNLFIGNYQINGQNVGYAYTISPRYWAGSITFSPATPCTGMPNSGNIIEKTSSSVVELALDNATTAGDLIYQWQKKEFCPGSIWQNIAGATSSTVTPSDPPGEYRCIVTCTNSGLSDTTIPYYVPVIDTATGDSVLVTTGGGFYCSDSTATVTLTANALDPSIPHTILWVGPNGFTSNNTTLTFPQVAGASGPSGTYHVYLMSDPCGSNPDVYDEAEIDIFIQQTPPPPSVPPLITYCLGSPADSISNQVYGKDIKWYSTPDSGTGTSVAPIVNTTLPGTYTYYVSQTYNNCESGRVPVTVRVVPQAPPPTVTTPYNYCQDDPAVALEAVGQNLLWYSVDSGGVGSSVVPTPSTATEGQTIWYVSQTIDGCESIRVPIEVNVSFRPNAVIVPSNKWVCAGEVLTISYDGNAKGNTNVVFNWNFPQGVTILSGSGEGPYQIRFDSAGTKRITLTVDNNGCKSREARYDIEVRPLPEYRIHMQEEACAEDVVNVSIIQLTPGVDTFLWDIAGGEKVYASETAGPYGIRWTEAGIKTISIIGRDNLCASPAETDEILIRALPDASFTIGGERVCAGDSMRMEARYNADYSYQWMPEQFFPVNHTSSVYAMVSHASDITLRVTDIYNCTSSSSQWITPENCCDILLPNAFTPNGDGRNDEFKILTNGNQKLSRFVIKNRWGQQVFETADATQGWDGSYGGVAQDMGVYFYYIKYLCSDGKYYEKSGELTLIR